MMFKLVELNKLSLYFDTNAQMVGDLTMTEIVVSYLSELYFLCLSLFISFVFICQNVHIFLCLLECLYLLCLFLYVLSAYLSFVITKMQKGSITMPICVCLIEQVSFSLFYTLLMT